MYSCGPIHMNEQKQDDQLEPTYCSSVPIRDVTPKTCRKEWTVEKGGEKGSGIYMLRAWHDDDIYIYIYIMNIYQFLYILFRDRILWYCSLFIICLDYVFRTSIDKIRENGIELTKKRSKRYPAKTITDADYAEDIVLLANTPNQPETLLHSLERAAAGIGLHVNAHKTEYMCYNQTSDFSTLDRTSLKLVDKFTYLVSSVSSTEKESTHG